jgi:plasmid maintenance system antidote protein VapI
MGKKQPADILRQLVKDSSSAHVAAALECTTATVYKLLAGGHPSLDVANAIKRVYGIETEAWGTVEDRKTVSK